MNELIAAFPQQLREAVEITKNPLYFTVNQYITPYFMKVKT